MVWTSDELPALAIALSIPYNIGLAERVVEEAETRERKKSRFYLKIKRVGGEIKTIFSDS